MRDAKLEPDDLDDLDHVDDVDHLDIAELADLYQANRDQPGVRRDRRHWAKLLTTALDAAFQEDERLFVQHTLLVVTAAVIAHAALGIDPRQVAPAALLSGQQLRRAQVRGVLEAGLFDWVAEVPRGDRFIHGLARRLARCAWAHAEHDVLKTFYESVIPAAQRKQLGEHYTPDWLAEKIVGDTVSAPLESRVLDPSCGSGTFVFHAVRRYLAAADEAGLGNEEALVGVCSHVMGMDLHPVAAVLARATYLLAMGARRLGRDRGPICIPIHCGDSLHHKLGRVDVLVGNPPWLSYRHMTRAMQAGFRRLVEERRLWPGAKSVTHADLSALFVVRAIERYLEREGRFAFVMPYAVLSRQHFSGLRTGVWPRPEGLPVCAKLDEPWDLHGVKPAFFEVPCSVLCGRRTDERQAGPLPQLARVWTGRLPAKNMTWSQACPHVSIRQGRVVAAPTTAALSPYAARFAQGASLVPRMMCLVEEMPARPRGGVADKMRVRSRRSAAEKQPWKSLPSLESSVEPRFILPVHLGNTVLPHRAAEPLRAVVPWDGTRLLDSGDDRLARYPGLFEWWTRAEALWGQHRSSERFTLIEQLDYRSKLSRQLAATVGPCSPVRIVYSKSGMYLAASVITDPAAVIDHKLYWTACASKDEAHYLAAILNSERLTLAVRVFQARGEHNPRDFDLYVWQVPIPTFDAARPLHEQLAALGADASAIVAELELPSTRFEKQRRFVRERLAATAAGKEIEHAVQELLEAGC